ncbi:hypothetical protein Focb16_v011391 [Fusarium oxysporum f. sp. cubense]|uniref:Uncharacterized protein n=1 Tax=Fusarium oxysporum f. sp. cubense TaxID=61366 RepID=A0A559LG69_FUSOC|nr:hypothetical protein Focb16_v011391 [Fusarium oxysporum f. sp. cubense]
MISLFLLLSLLTLSWASPAPLTPLSIFNDNSIKTVNQPDSGLLNFTLHSRDTLEKRALSLAYLLCDVTFNGLNNANWQPFQVKGELMLVQGIPSSGTTNGANPYDVVISIGTPISNPVAGSISYVTNRYLNPFISGRRDLTRLDFARVSATSNTVTVSVDTSLAAANQISVFNARSGLTANIYNPATGGFNLVFGNNGAISGKIVITGRAPVSGGQAPYQAIISGKVKQKGTFLL